MYDACMMHGCVSISRHLRLPIALHRHQLQIRDREPFAVGIAFAPHLEHKLAGDRHIHG